MLERAKLGMAMLLLSEAVFFLFLIIAFVYFHTSETELTGVNFSSAVLYTAFLAASSFTIWRAAASARGSGLWLSGTILLAAPFLWGQWSEIRYAEPGRHLASAFFTLMGCHELHAAIGIVLLGGMFLFPSGERRSVAVKTLALYWYFVTAARVAIFITVVWVLV
jgi:heme/copper-type cytochrome/quinol oxidase subunit 3